jgi:hypothetical protein
MTHKEYGLAQANIQTDIRKFINDKYIKALIPEKVSKTLTLILDFLQASKDLLFVSGSIKKLNLLNVVSWFRFVKVARLFVIDVITVWK